ncbi:MAG TPA: hypothetical protein VG272_12360 [Candidatus Acidoferrales bacterium]|nr:hypothetical protein [Candidatus Acidoferrales bacterium]
MPVCKLCERDFTQEEIDNGVTLPHTTASRIRLVRFSNGTLHQFEKKSNVQLPHGTYVTAKPTPVEAPLAEVEALTDPVEQPPQAIETPDAGQQPDVESLAHDLDAHFHPEPELPEAKNIGLNKAEADDGYVDCFVVFMTSHDTQGRGRGPIGIARKVNRRRDNHDGFRFRVADVVTTGGETIKPGSKIRGRVVADSEYERLIDIEVYIPQEKSKRPPSPVKKREPAIKIYKHDEEE